VSIPPATPVLSEHYRAPVYQQQPPHHAAMHVTQATRGMFHGQTHHFRGLGAAYRDAKNAQQGKVCGTLSSRWPLWFCLQIWVCCREPCVSNSSCEGAVLRESSWFSSSWFSRVRSRKRHEKRAAGHSLQHSLIALASMVRSATLNMQVGALRDQQQLRENCFVKMFVRR